MSLGIWSMMLGGGWAGGLSLDGGSGWVGGLSLESKIVGG